ncbi:MAG: DUF58 domain-containing protein, partial [Cyanobacteria bacterium]|nr:DUF58 domain-containing protein [Cyanobacteriota bacterium]
MKVMNDPFWLPFKIFSEGLFHWLQPVLDPIGYVETLAKQGVDSTGPLPGEVISKDVLKAIKADPHSLYSGGKKTLLKGQGIEFKGLCEYAPGDDVRKMDWNIFARTQTPYIREYHPEKDWVCWIVVDFTPSMYTEPSDGSLFSRNKALSKTTNMESKFASKAEEALSVAIQMAHQGVQEGCRVGCIAFTGVKQEQMTLFPKPGEIHLQRLTHQLCEVYDQGLLHYKEGREGEPLDSFHFETICKELSRVLTRRSWVLMMSDFQWGPCLSYNDPHYLPGWMHELGQLAQKTMFFPVWIQSPPK